jgi:DNA-directed RNA polymerase specialized sigma24 family protein
MAYKDKEKHLAKMRECQRRRRAKTAKVGTKKREQLKAKIAVINFDLSELDPVTQTIIEKYLSGETHKAIALAVGVSSGTVGNRIKDVSQALVKLEALSNSLG